MNGYEHYQSKRWLSNTGLCMMNRCPRLYFYAEGCNMKPSTKGNALYFGGGIHRGIPYAIKGEIEKAIQAFLIDWKDEYNDEKRNIMRAKAMFENFYDCHRDDRSIYIPLPAPEGRVKTPEHATEYEVPFAVDLGMPIPFIGLVDCLAQHKHTGKKWVVETKTTSQLGQQFLSSFELATQVQGYALAMKILLGEEIEGVFVEGLLVAKVSCDTQIVPVYIKDFVLEDMLQLITSTYKRIAQCEAEQNFPKHFSGCNQISMFGLPGYTCPYISLCNVTQNWTDLMSEFVVEERKQTPFGE